MRERFSLAPTLGQEKFFSEFGKYFYSSDLSVFLLTGYAGTGKTSLISTLVQSLPLFNYKYMLLAPTGRAAKVMSGYSNRAAYTIHKVIYKLVANPDTGSFHFAIQKNYHKKTVFIVDEASMLSDSGDYGSNNVLSDLIEFVFSNSSNKLILVGDSAQLPPVGQTLSKALDIHYFENKDLKVFNSNLDEVMRQELESGILKNATLIRSSIGNKKGEPQLETGGYQDIFSLGYEKLEDGLRYGYEKYGVENSIIICRSNRSAVRYNQMIRRHLLYYENELDAGDIIMCVKNNYFYTPEQSSAGFIANGDLLEVRKVYGEEEMYGFRFNDLEVKFAGQEGDETFEVKILLESLNYPNPSIPPEESRRLYEEVLKDQGEVKNKRQMKEFLRNDPYLNALQVKFAYAMTCHKSQGGQWDCVFIDHGFKNDNDQRNEYLRWLYTAVTRATRELFLVNFPKSLF